MTRYLNRRQFAFGCACCASTVSFPQATPASAPTFQGCLISSEGYQQYRTNAEGLYGASDGLIARNRHFRTTGDPALDRDLDKALGVIADLFSVNPAFGFMIQKSSI
jgi:hypothetical protein